MCIICMSPMLRTESTIALRCGHVYHDECVTEYAEVKGWDKDQACPIRCGQAAVLEVEAGEEERGHGAHVGQGTNEGIEDLQDLLEQTLMDAGAL